MLDAAKSGAPWALERLWRTYAAAVAGYLRVQGADDPDGLTSDAFLGAFRAIAGFDGGEPQFRSWLFTIAHRRLIDERRRNGRRPVASLDEVAMDALGGAEDPEAEALRSLATARVRSLCDELVPDQRDVLLLRIVGGLTVDEVAASLGKSAGAVKALQRRALAALRRKMSREGVSL